MELKLLQSFHAVADLLHFRRAAQRIGVTQPALSQHIAKLEGELGVQLFERDRRMVKLTSAGQTLRDETAGPLQQLGAALESTKRVGGLLEKTLKVGQLQYISHVFLPPAIQSLKRARPEVLVELVEVPSNEIESAVREGRVDIGFGSIGMHRHDDLVTREVMRGFWAVWVAKDHPFAQLDEVPLQRLAEEPLILFARNIAPTAYDFLTRLLERTGSRPRVMHHIQQPQHGVPLALQGLGCFVVGSYVIPDAPRGAVMKRISGFDNDLRITAMWRPDGRTSLLRPFLAGLPKLKT
jgi:DNA-binding transcriptional LysR family regulator